MARKIDWESHVGRRIRLRDLHVFLAASQHGSMARAAAHLGVSQPAVSEIISNLEHAVGVKLLDRGPHGVEPTIYGRALLQRSVAAFDELKQGVREIEHLADPSSGELRIGSAESIAASILAPVVQSFSTQYPNVILQVDPLTSPTLAPTLLRNRALDIVLARFGWEGWEDADDLHIETLFEDYLVVVAAKSSPWARRRKIDIAELINEPWLLLTPDTWNNRVIGDALRARGLKMPKIPIVTFSFHVRATLVSTGSFISALPNSTVRLSGHRYPLKVLPIELPHRPWPLGIVKLKHRTLSPVAELFVERLRAFTASYLAEWKP